MQDWDDEMDGEWEPPMIDNPDYKGEWKPRQIDNPDYKGNILFYLHFFSYLLCKNFTLLLMTQHDYYSF